MIFTIYSYKNIFGNHSGLAVLVSIKCSDLRCNKDLTHTNCSLDFCRVLKRLVAQDATNSNKIMLSSFPSYLHFCWMFLFTYSKFKRNIYCYNIVLIQVILKLLKKMYMCNRRFKNLERFSGKTPSKLNLQKRCFSVIFCNIFKKICVTKHLGMTDFIS